MISLANSVLGESKQKTNTVKRLKRYLEALKRIEPASTITMLVFTRKPTKPTKLSDGLLAIPVQASRVQALPILGLAAARVIASNLSPDIITAQNPFEAGLLGLLLSQRFNVPLEVQIHTQFLSKYWLKEHPLWNRFRYAIAKVVLEQASAIRAVSAPIKHALTIKWSHLKKRDIAVIPVPVYYETRSSSTESRNDIISNSDKDVILFVGRLCYPKNLPGLFEITERILIKRSDVDFILVGDGPNRTYAENSALRIAPRNIHVIGRVPYESIPNYYKRATALILPSLYEGFGRVILESYLFETPAVATRCGGPEDIILNGKTGFLTDVNDLETFAKHLLWLLDNQDAAATMGQKGREYIQQAFSPEHLIERMVNQWQKLTTKESTL
jgi:glycosyltransferase involved in cell wall biosynthesis